MTDQETSQSPAAITKSDKLKWYVVHTYSGFENRAKKTLEERIKQMALETYFGDILIPVETVEETRNGQKRMTKRKFAPGYIFVHMEMRDDTWHCVKNTAKVTGFIGADKNDRNKLNVPSVPEKQVLAMTQQLTETAAKPAPKIDFDVGDNVRVVDGNFVNFSGSVAEVNHGKQKVRVTITIFGRATPVELDFNQVAKV